MGESIIWLLSAERQELQLKGGAVIMEIIESIKKDEEVKIDEVTSQEEAKKEIISVGMEYERKSSHYPEGRKPHY